MDGPGSYCTLRLLSTQDHFLYRPLWHELHTNKYIGPIDNLYNRLEIQAGLMVDL